ncbi:bacteriophage phi 1.45 protein-like protein [Desulfocucumis palustris]|uniref:Bacteriophage phi 1.45 protein-like protein n=1 Tax=Desulfocucumis palustris TaxID=1898651 RepID=A0A2L2XGF1_9FIRM|nr:HNH endonuclease signature motif containing protein [Desulfocucumis palustris]GBF35427.1 bacteriophage phi 1.45 protein-like protein [Desulfocucumis palustris]
MNRKYTQEHIDYVAANIQGCPFKELTDMFNRRFGMNLKVSAMISLADRHGLHNGRDTRILPDGTLLGVETRFRPGLTPWNKGMKGFNCGGKETQFKKGNKPANWVPIGSERVNGDGYIDIKVDDGKLQKNWKGKHILIWEEHNGPIPPGHVVIFGDGNNRNFNPENLLLVSRAQLVRLNQMKMIQEDAELTKAGIAIADICNKIGERKRAKV